MNKKIALPIIIATSLIALYFSYTYFSKKPYHVPITTQLILMSIDETEPSTYGGQIDKSGRLVKTTEIGASGVDLLTGLYQEECIIIVTSSVVSYVMRFMKEISPSPLELEPTPPINLGNWIKKKVSDYLYILIPKKYIETRVNYAHVKNNAQQNTKYTPEELTVGIAFVAKEDISDKDFMSAEYHKKNSEYPEKYAFDYIGEFKTEFKTSWISDHVVKNLDKIFIPYTVYSDQKNVPQTAFLLFGHGSKYVSLDERMSTLSALQNDPKISSQFKKEVEEEIESINKLKNSGEKAYHAGRIAGLQGKDFGTFVCYLQNNLKLSVLFTSTCFGAEINLEKGLQDSIHDESACKEFEHLSFPIISGAISSAVAMGGYLISSLARDDERMVVLKRPDYNKFFEALLVKTSTSDNLFFNALHFIYPFYERYESFNNIPSIKYPGQPWRPLEIPKIIVTLDDSVIKNSNSIDITPYFATKKVPQIIEDSGMTKPEPPPLHEFLSYKFEYPNVLFLAKANMPFELIISGDSKIDLPAFISHIPGDAVHHFAKINASTYSLSQFLEAFFTIHDLYDTKTFIIDELMVKNDLTVLPSETGKDIILHNVILQNKPIPHSNKPPQKSVFFETGVGVDIKEWGAENISMGNPIAFAIKPLKKSGKIKEMLSEIFKK